MYALDGTRRLPEAELPWLAGYEGSRPVRTGNAASGQLQLDVWGETLDGLSLARESGIGTRDGRVGRADRPDGAPRGQPGTSPTTGCGRCAARGGTSPTPRSWRGWPPTGCHARSASTRRCTARPTAGRRCATPSTPTSSRTATTTDRGTFTQSYGGTALDASLLLIPRVGFLPATDPRVRGTIEAIRRELTQDGFVRRYQTTESDDGLPGGEGLFLACSFWLVDALHLAGRQREAIDAVRAPARAAQRRRAAQRGVGPRRGRQLGNTPQAFSHFPLVISALQLHAGRPHRSDEAIHHAKG